MNKDDNTPLYEDLSDIPAFDEGSENGYPDNNPYISSDSRFSGRQSSSTYNSRTSRRSGSSRRTPAKLKTGVRRDSRQRSSSRVYPNGYTGRKNTRRTSASAERAALIRRQRATLIIFALIVLAALILIIVGISSALKGSSGSSTDNTQTLVSNSEQQTSVTITPAPTAAAATAAPENDITGLEITAYDSLITVGDSAYEFYKFDSAAASTAITALNDGDTKLSVPMQCMLIPTSIDIMLPLSLLDEYADQTSDQQKAESYFLSQLEDTITPVYTYDLLKAHCNEKLYFNTDSHINGLTAYYVYTAWCEKEGVTPVSLDKCTKKEYPDFFGNISNQTGLYLTTDTVEVYEVPYDFSYSYTDDNGQTQDGQVYVDVSNYSSLSKYQAFCGGAHSYSIITNNSKSDGSSCLIITDSNGFAVAPFIASHYEKTHIVDYRYYESGAMDLANQLGVDDVIVVASTNLTAYSSLADSLSNVMK